MLESFAHAAGTFFLHLAIDQSLQVHIRDCAGSHRLVSQSHTQSNCC